MVEDEQSLREPVAKILRRRGFTIIETPDGLAAIDQYRARSHEIAVVLLDITLPVLSGAEVMARLEEIRPDVKIILTSAYSEESVIETLGGRRPWAYVRKPYSPNELADLLYVACTRRLSAGYP